MGGDGGAVPALSGILERVVEAAARRVAAGDGGGRGEDDGDEAGGAVCWSAEPERTVGDL